MLVRGGELLSQGDEVVTQFGELGSEVVLGAGEPDHFVPIAGPGRVDSNPSHDRLHTEQMLQGGIDVGTAFLPLICAHANVVSLTNTEAIGVRLDDGEVTPHELARQKLTAIRAPCWEHKTELSFLGSVLRVACF